MLKRKKPESVYSYFAIKKIINVGVGYKKKIVYIRFFFDFFFFVLKPVLYLNFC